MNCCVKILVAFSLYFLPTVSVAQLNSGLEAYWQFDGDTFDAAGSFLDFDTVGEHLHKPGLIGCAIDFIGNRNQYLVRSEDDEVFNIGGDDFTVQVWVNFATTAGEQTLFEKFTGGAGPGYTITKLTSNQIQFFASGLGVLNSTPVDLIPGTWKHILVRRSGNDVSIFVDNTSVAETSLSGTVNPSPNPLRIGERQGIQQFPVNGAMDEVAFWSRAVSNEEITQLFNDGNGFPLLPTPPVLLGDTNQDGDVNLLDVAPFIELLSSGEYQAEADVNEDCVVNLLDVSGFIDILSGN